jgi:guanylate kinase
MDWLKAINNGRIGKGILFVISSVSGGGKTTVISRLMEDLTGLSLAVSHTTREPRENEREGIEYFFVTREYFERMIEKEDFLEWADVYGHLYGTSKKAVDKLLTETCDVILDIDVQGAMQIKEKRPEAVLIFIAPPDEREQARRLITRGTETEEELRKRLEAAREELALAPEYDYAVRNDQIEETVQTVKAIIVAERCRPCGRPRGKGTEGKP